MSLRSHYHLRSALRNFGGITSRPEALLTLSVLYIAGAYWFAPSTRFARTDFNIARIARDLLRAL